MLKKGKMSRDAARRIQLPWLADCLVEYQPGYLRGAEYAEEVFYEGLLVATYMSLGLAGVIPSSSIPSFPATKDWR
jgi:hypothetical protein